MNALIILAGTGIASACSPGTKDDHTRKEKTKETSEKSSSKGGKVAGNAHFVSGSGSADSNTTTKVEKTTTVYFKDCGKKDCKTSSSYEPKKGWFWG